MANKKKVIRTVYFNLGLPEDLAARVKLDLFSDVEGRIPLGAIQEFFTMLVREHYVRKQGAAVFGAKYEMAKEDQS